MVDYVGCAAIHFHTFRQCGASIGPRPCQEFGNRTTTSFRCKVVFFAVSTGIPDGRLVVSCY